jgi:purine-cytosine permease-like protein
MNDRMTGVGLLVTMAAIAALLVGSTLGGVPMTFAANKGIDVQTGTT